jgi:hypothetical protein
MNEQVLGYAANVGERCVNRNMSLYVLITW